MCVPMRLHFGISHIRDMLEFGMHGLGRWKVSFEIISRFHLKIFVREMTFDELKKAHAFRGQIVCVRAVIFL